MDSLAFIGLSISVLTMLVSGTAYAVRQEGRINGHSLKFDEREKQDELRERSDEIRFQEIIRRLDRIERKQDTNGKA